jgi:HEAT repeat protein
MRRIFLVVLLVGMTSDGATQEAAGKAATVDLLKAAVGNAREGARARATLVNEASARAGELIAALKHEDDEVRLSAAWALRYSAQKKAIPALVDALRDENFSVARAAAASLKEFKAVEQPLRRLMRDKDSAMRWRGLINVEYLVLQRLMGDVAELAMNDPVDFVRADAAWTLRHASGPKVAEALIKCLADPNSRARYHADIGLRGRVGPELMKKGSAARKQAIATLLWILEKRKDRSYATDAAVGLLTRLLVDPLEADPAKWRAFLKKVEGEQ